VKDFKIFEASPGNSMLLLPDSPRFTVVSVTNDFLISTATKKEDIIGKGYFEIFSPDQDLPMQPKKKFRLLSIRPFSKKSQEQFRSSGLS
jgi:hypothetical protein